MYRCPNCHTTIYPARNESNVLFCNCGTVLRTKNEQGIVTLIPAKLKPLLNKHYQYLQPGSTGEWKGKRFTITGRLVVKNSSSTFNYWAIAFNDGSTTFLTEGYGHYSIFKKIEFTEKPRESAFKALKATETARLNADQYYRLIRKTSYEIPEVEGELELPEPAIPFKTYEFFNEKLGYIEIHFYKNDEYAVFELEFQEPGKFKFENTVSQVPPVLFPCKKCNTPLTSVAVPYVRSLICPDCSTAYSYDYSTDNFEPLTTVFSRGSRTTPYLPIGSTGSFNGIPFIVAGFCRKQEVSPEKALWNEYTLYNPREGFAYLSEYNGHWVYVKEWPRPPLKTFEGPDYFVENDNDFELYNQYGYKVIFAAGEHIYDIHKTSGIYVREYIAPPQTLIQEKTTSEECWFYGEYINARKVKNNFQMQAPPPAQQGTGSVQPLL